MADLKGKRIIVTGAGSGIGRASCKLAASQGADVVAVDINESVNETADIISSEGGSVLAVQGDVSDETSVAGFVQACVEKFGGIDGIYANAGIGGAGKPFLEMTVEDWQRTLGVNTIGVFLCIKHAVPHFMAQESGAIVCTASVAGLQIRLPTRSSPTAIKSS